MTILLWIVAALGVVCLALAVLYLVVRLHNNDLAKALSITRNQKNNLMRENVHLCEDLEGTRATIKARDIEIAGLYGEKTAFRLESERWRDLYNELLKTLNDLQGDAHATVPLVEVAHVPMTIAEASVEKAAPVKRTRKKAGAQ